MYLPAGLTNCKRSTLVMQKKNRLPLVGVEEIISYSCGYKF